MSFYFIDLWDDDDGRRCGVIHLEAASTADACVWANLIVREGQHAVIWDSDDNLLCTVGQPEAKPAIH